jgi:hypothetical protein
MKGVTGAALLAAMLLGCGPVAPGNEILGRWRADLTNNLPAADRANVMSIEMIVSFEAMSSYTLTFRAVNTATAMLAPGCTTIVTSTGGIWSVMTAGGVNTLTTRPLPSGMSGTTERLGCSNGADNFARREATVEETFSIRGGNYSLMGNTLVLTPSGESRSITFTRQ